MPKQEKNSDVVIRLKTLMGHDGIHSCKEIAAKTGIAESTLRKWLSGESFPTADNLLAFAKEYGYSMNWILFGIGPQQLKNCECVASSDDKWKEKYFEEVEAHRHTATRMAESLILQTVSRQQSKQGHQNSKTGT